MKKYVVKDSIINIKTGEQQTWYIGKDGYVHDERTKEFADGYARKGDAQRKINRDKAWYITWEKAQVINPYTIQERDWLHVMTIEERESE